MKISVVIPVYNAARTIRECLDSVITELTSVVCPWEIIVVNDGSQDASLEEITRYKEASPHAEYIRIITQDNQGVAAARNTGMSVSEGDFIAFNDSDDRWLPGKIKLQIDYLLNHPSVGMVAGIFGQDRVSVIKKIGYENIITIRDQVFKNYFSPQCVLFRRSVLEKTGSFHPQMRYAEEGYFFNRMVYYFRCVLLNVKVTESITHKGRWGDSGLSGNLWGMEKGELFNLREAYKAGFISLGLYGCATAFSLLKYFRRRLLTFLR